MTTILETPRLVLRHVDPEADFEVWADCFADKKRWQVLAAGLG